MGALLILAVTFGLMYALLIRPQQKRVREQQSLVRETEVGDEVMTSSGIYGIVTELEDDTLLIEVAEGIEVRMARGAIAKILTKAADIGTTASPSSDKNTDKNKAKPKPEPEEHDEPSDTDDAHDNS